MSSSLPRTIHSTTETFVMSSRISNLISGELYGPYPVTDSIEILSDICQFISESDLSEKGKQIRIGQISAKMTRCCAANQRSNWPGLEMVNREFDRTDLYLCRDGSVVNVIPMVVDTEGDSYDFDEARGKVDFMIPVEEIRKRAESVRDNQNYEI